MTACHRLTIRSIDPDPRSAAIRSAAEQLGTPLDPTGPNLLGDVAVADLVFLEGDLDDRDLESLHRFLVDPLLQEGTWAVPPQPGVEVAFLPGVTDGAAATLLHAASRLGVPVAGAATGRRIEFGTSLDEQHADAIVRRVVANPVIERWSFEPIEPVFHAGGTGTGVARVASLRGLDLDQLIS
ncbi:MAG: purS, partial [Desertimonas sp.]|nr:purS [Desertimonas sp.]